MFAFGMACAPAHRRVAAGAKVAQAQAQASVPSNSAASQLDLEPRAHPLMALGGFEYSTSRMAVDSEGTVIDGLGNTYVGGELSNHGASPALAS